MPKILAALYELRNNRAIAHVSADIDPNHMDGEFFLRGMKWVIGEMVRNFSQLPFDDAHAVTEAVTARTFRVVWSAGDVRRILGPRGEHLVSLARHSDVVLVLLLTMADRLVLEDDDG